jgi:cytochrome P450
VAGGTTTGDQQLDEPAPLTLARWAEVREAFRARTLRQALYDSGRVVMSDCLLNLHGADHLARRRLENRLFRRETFQRWERHLLQPTIDATMGPIRQEGSGDLVDIGYRLAMNLTARIAGVDLDEGDPDATERLRAYVAAFSEAATLVHSTRDHATVEAEVLATMADFEQRLLAPSIERRRAALDGGGEPPGDVLGVLLANQDRLALGPDAVLREICFYLQAGAHSTANAFVHTVDELDRWVGGDPVRLRAAGDDLGFLQLCTHEALRLYPASPVAWRRAVEPTTLRTGHHVEAGQLVVLDLSAANRDPEVFGPDADRFDPHRRTPDDVAGWGHSFGGGAHACIGQELDAGLTPSPSPSPSPGGEGADHLYGTVPIMVWSLLVAGGRPDPDDAPERDPGSTRHHFSRYPVRFDPVGS